MPSKSPNIILVFVDNQPADMLGCSGNREIHTPHLDAFAGSAVRFTNAFCPNAMCSPCRASVLTGLMPSQHGIHTWLDDAKIDEWPKNWNAIDEFETMPGLLADNGYDTALIGKYHLGIAEKPQNDFRHWVTLQLGHIMSFYNNDMIVNHQQIASSEHAVEFFTNRAIEYIDQRSAEPERPFFLFLTYPAPYGHWPALRDPTLNPFSDLYQDTPFTSAPREAVSKELIDWILLRNEKLPEDEPEYYRTLAQIPNDLPTLRNYYSQMSMVDDCVGKLLATLERNSISQDTAVIYTADHGMSLGRHGFWGHGEDTWPSNTHRQAHHIPLIIRAPGTRFGKVEDAMVATTDLLATVLDLAGLALPPHSQSPSRSLRPFLEQTEPEWRDAVFMEQEETRAIRTKDWLFMQRYEPTPYNFRHELYNLQNDPDERNNLAMIPEYQVIKDELSGRIEAYFSRYSDPRWDLWNGGSVKSNSTRPFLWQEVWGPDWQPSY